MLFWIGLFVGLFLGAVLGLVVAGLCASAAEQDERMGTR